MPTPRKLSASLIAAIALASSLAPCARAADWPQWGGANWRSMVSKETNLPDTFVSGKHTTGTVGIDLSAATNVKWAAEIGNLCYGSPVVAQGRVLCGTNLINGDPRFNGSRATIACFDEKTGKPIWMFSTPHPETPNLARVSSLGSCASPTVDGDRVYANGWTDILCLALDGQKDPRPASPEQTAVIAGRKGKPVPASPIDGKLLWHFDIPTELGIDMHDALAPAPLVVGNMLVISTGNGVKQDHKTYATPDLPCLVALDKMTGKIVAADNEFICRHTFHGQWSSPSLVSINGKDQIIWGGGDGVCYSFDTTPEPGGKYGGTFKKIWSYDINRGNTKVYKSAGGPSEIISTPVCVDNKVYISTGQDWTHGNPKGHVSCVDATLTGAISQPIWDYTEAGSCVGTVAVEGGLAYIADLGGLVHCLDAATGKLLWKYSGAAPFHASPLIADGKVYIADNRGKLYIFAHARTQKLLSTIDLHGESAGACIAANGTLYVTSLRMLQAVAKP